MTLGEAELIFNSWRDTPPAHYMLQVIARMLGWKPAATGATEAGDARTRILAISGFSERPVGEGLPAVLNFEQLKRAYRRSDPVK
jgi:hypothetical protein